MARSGETSLVVGSCFPESMGSRAGNRRKTQVGKSQALLLGQPQWGQNTRLAHMNQYSVPFCGQILFYYIDMLILFIHSPANGYLGCFYILLTMNNAAVNIQVVV